MHRVPEITPSDAAPTEARELFDLTGRVALVTGGTRGLGLAIARTFASAGADLVIASRNEQACAEIATEFETAGVRALACPCHVGRWDDIERLVETAYDAFGRIDVLVNNAGIAPVYETLGGVERGALRQDDRGQSQGPVSSHGTGRRPDGGGRRRLGHQRVEHRSDPAHARTSSRMPPPRPA